MKNLSFIVSIPAGIENHANFKDALRNIDLSKANLSYKPAPTNFANRTQAEIVAKQLGFTNVHNTNMGDIKNKVIAMNPFQVTLTGRSKDAIVQNFGRFLNTFNGQVLSPVYNK